MAGAQAGRSCRSIQILHNGSIRARYKSRCSRGLPLNAYYFCILLLLVHNSQFGACSRQLGAAAAKPEQHRGRLFSRLRLRLRETPNSQAVSFTAAQTKALTAPMTVAIMSHHYFGSEYGRDVTGCNFHDIELNCTFFPKANVPLLADLTELSRSADAVWWHAPNTCFLQVGPWATSTNATFSSFKARPEQLAVIASMESSSYYKCLDDAAFMSQFDVEMTYRRRSAIPLLYWGEGYRETWERMAPLPVSKKQDAVVYINSNCQAPSGRNVIVADLQRQPGVRVDALGGCLNTGLKLPQGAGAKFDAFRQYKYCVAMENSIAEDYVTEKVYDALAAGCVPIYLGAPNIADFVPTTDAIIDYTRLGSAELLAAELLRLSANETAYLEKLRWREHPETWGEGFREMVSKTKSSAHSQCQLCQLIAKRRLEPPSSYKPSPGRPLTSISGPRLNQSSLLPNLPQQRLKIKYKLSGAPATMEDIISH